MSLQAQVEQLRGEVAGHKADIRRSRTRLARAKAELVELEARCAQLGIRLVVQGEGKGDPWPKNGSADESQSSASTH